jgi:AcrR family transcriptional regulator
MPKIVDHDLYRKELLNHCFDLLAEKGYAAITMRQIAQEIGVSTGTLYHYFPSKEAIFEQLVEAMAERDLSQVSRLLKPTHTLAERLEVAFNFLDANRDYFFKQVMIFLDFYQHQQRLQDYKCQVLSQVCEQIEQAITQLLGISDPDVATLLYSLIDGLLISHIYGGEPVSISRQGKLIAEMITIYLSHQAALNSSENPAIVATH